MSEHAIVCRDLTKRFTDVTALDHLDLEVPRGSLFGFLGPNGAGKTTVMRLLLGLARPTAGSAQVLGFDAVAESLEVRRRVGYLPQQPLFPPELTAREVMRYAAGFYPHDRDGRIDDDISEVLDLVGLRTKADSRSGALSGGQRQRLGIAQAQVHGPELLILDEPAAALDPLGRRDVLEVMRRLQETATVFYSTHILDDVQQVSDEVAILKAGRRVLQAPMSEVLRGGTDQVFDLEVAGPVDRVVAEVRSQPWVAAVRIAEQPAATTRTLVVETRDPETAYRDLLRLVLADRDVQVRAFGPRTSELEDVFIDLVEGGNP